MTVTTSMSAVSIVCLSSIAGWTSWRSFISSAPPTSGLDLSLLVKAEGRLGQLDQPLVLSAENAQVMELTVWIAIAMLTAIIGVFIRYAMYQPPQLQPPGVEVGAAGFDEDATGRHAITAQRGDNKCVATTGALGHGHTLLEMELASEPHSQENEAEVCREVHDTAAQGIVGLGTILPPAVGEQSLVQMLLERELELALGREQDSDSGDDGESSSNEDKDTLSTASASGAASEDAESTSNESGPPLRCRRRHRSPYVSIQARRKQHEIELDAAAQKVDVDAQKDAVTFAVLGTMCSLPRLALDSIERAGFDVSFTEDDCVSKTEPASPCAVESIPPSPRIQEVIGDWMGRRRTMVPQLFGQSSPSAPKSPVLRISESDEVPHAHAVEEASSALNYISF